MDISVIAFLAFLAVAGGLGAAVMVVKDLLRGRKRSGDSPDDAPLRLRRVPRDSTQTSAPGLAAAFDRWFLQLVRETGLAMTPVAATLLMVFCGVVFGSALFVLNEQPALALVGMLIGMVVGLAFLMVRRAQRVKLLQEQLPDALDTLARSMRAGQSLDQAVRFTGQQIPEPLAGEFRVCAKQLAMGLSISAVMRSLVDRVRLFDVRIFTLR